MVDKGDYRKTMLAKALLAAIVCSAVGSVAWSAVVVKNYGTSSPVHKKARSNATKHGRSHYAPAAFRVPTYYGSSLNRPSYNNAVQYSAPTFRTAAGDYLHQMGGQSRWPDGKCIRVFVAPARKTFPGIVANCFNQWSKACGGKFSWTFTSNPNSADYTIGWTTRTQALSTGDEAGITTTDTSVDPMSDAEVIEHAHTRVLTRYQGQTLSDNEIAKTMLHEVGHGLGLEGHSSNPQDIMYYAVSPKQSFRLSARDANTMGRLYAN